MWKLICEMGGNMRVKSLGKTLGMNKNEARNYAIKILNTVNPKVFNNQYEN